MSDLKHSTQKAIAWSALDRVGQQAVYALTFIVSARLLAPEMFGMIAPLALFSGMANVLSEGGLSVALIRKKDATELDHNTMFFFNLALSLLFYGVLFFAAPAIAAYNRTPELTLIARVQLAGIVLYAPGLIQATGLIRRGDFRRLAVANVVPLLLSGATVIALAALGFGVWALVAQALVLAASRTAILWSLSDWRPGAMFSFASFRGLFGFSSKLLAGSLLTSVSSTFYTSAIGRDFPMSQVGFYDRANKFKEAGSSSVVYAFGNSIFRMLAGLQDDPPRFVHAWRKSMRTVSFVAFAVLPGLAAAAPSLVEVLFGARWLPAVPYIRLLCLSGLLAVFNQMHGNALKVKGRSDITLTVEAAGAVLLVGFFYLTVRYGLQTAIVSDAASRGIVLAAYALIDRRVFGYRLRDQLRDAAPYALLGAAMAALLWWMPRWIGNPWAALPGQLVAGAGFYLGAARLTGSTVLREVWNTVFVRKGTSKNSKDKACD
jgi:O-antigen/teichoic acid export membrane protein